jgi:hypothetical protein
LSSEVECSALLPGPFIGSDVTGRHSGFSRSREEAHNEETLNLRRDGISRPQRSEALVQLVENLHAIQGNASASVERCLARPAVTGP